MSVDRRRDPPDWKTVHNIAVCVPDHLGDLLIVVPALKLLRTLAPQAKIVLIVGDWTIALASFLKTGGIVDEVVTYSMALLDRSDKSLIAKYHRERETRAAALPILRQKQLDLFFDLRAFSPNAWSLARASNARFRMGFGLRGMAFTYHQLIAFDFGKPMGQLYLNAVGGLGGVSATYRGPELPSAIGQAVRVLPTKTPPYLVIQLYSAELGKNVPASLWQDIMEKLGAQYSLVLAGTREEGVKAAADRLVPSGATGVIWRDHDPRIAPRGGGESRGRRHRFVLRACRRGLWEARRGVGRGRFHQRAFLSDE